jgi:hypothetical protein
MGHKILDIFMWALKVTIGLAIAVLIIRNLPEGTPGGVGLNVALDGIFGTIGQLDDLVREARGASV